MLPSLSKFLISRIFSWILIKFSRAIIDELCGSFIWEMPRNNSTSDRKKCNEWKNLKLFASIHFYSCCIPTVAKLKISIRKISPLSLKIKLDSVVKRKGGYSCYATIEIYKYYWKLNSVTWIHVYDKYPLLAVIKTLNFLIIFSSSCSAR